MKRISQYNNICFNNGLVIFIGETKKVIGESHNRGSFFGRREVYGNYKERWIRSGI